MRRLRILLVLVVLLAAFGTAWPASAQSAALATQTTSNAASFVYYVLPGDTLSKIAVRFGTTVSAIVRANPSIKNPNLIRVGQRLVIPLPGTTPQFSRVKMALISVDDGGSVGCGDSVVMVERQIAPTTAPLTAAIRELLSIKEQHYGQSGLYNALYQSNLTIQSVSIVNKTATIRLKGQLQSGGVCDDPRIIAQFEQTARQFSTVSSVQVYVNDILLQTLLSGK